MLPGKKITGFVVLLFLRLHNLSYKVISIFAPHLEKDNLHPKHRIMKYHDWFLNNIAKDSVVLDAGCGNGALTFALAKKARKVVGVDSNKSNIRFARQRFSRENIEFMVGDVTKIRLETLFDYAVLSNILEHIEDRPSFLKSLKGLTANLLIRVPLFNRDWITPYKKEMGLEWRLDKTHFVEYTPESFSKEMDSAGYNIVHLEINWGEAYAIAKRK